MTERISGSSGNLLEISSSGGIETNLKPGGVLGSYSFSVTSGTLAAALAAGAPIFSFRWGNATRFAVIHRLKLKFQTLTLFTAAQLVDFGFDALVGRTFTTAPIGGTGLTLASPNFKKRATMAATLATDIRIASTAALTGAVVTLDAHPFAASIGDPQRVNPAAGTEEQSINNPTLEWEPNLLSGEYPLVLAQNEGIIIANRALWPIAGTGIIQVDMAWSEVASY